MALEHPSVHTARVRERRNELEQLLQQNAVQSSSGQASSVEQCEAENDTCQHNENARRYNAFVIHISEQADRWQRMEQRFSDEGLLHTVKRVQDQPLVNDSSVQELTQQRLNFFRRQRDGSYTWDLVGDSSPMSIEPRIRELYPGKDNPDYNVQDPQKVARYVAVGQAHSGIWERGIHNGSDVLIFENDVRLIRGFRTRLRNAVSELPDNWDMLLLDAVSPTLGVVGSHQGDGVYLCKDCVQTGAYLVRGTAMRRMLDLRKKAPYAFVEEAVLYNQLFNNTYTVLPRLAVQEMRDSACQTEVHMHKLRSYFADALFSRDGHLYGA